MTWILIFIFGQLWFVYVNSWLLVGTLFETGNCITWNIPIDNCFWKMVPYPCSSSCRSQGTFICTPLFRTCNIFYFWGTHPISPWWRHTSGCTLNLIPDKFLFHSKWLIISCKMLFLLPLSGSLILSFILALSFSATPLFFVLPFPLQRSEKQR